MSRAAAPFSAQAVLALLLVGFASFLLLLYAIGTGWDGGEERDGGAHAASNGLTGFAALAALLEAEGHGVSLSRNAAALEGDALLVLTPPAFTDGEELARIIEQRRFVGPTLLILPKWAAMAVPDDPRIEAEEGWVILADLWGPNWLSEIGVLEQLSLVTGQARGWRGLGLAGALPEPESVQALDRNETADFWPLIEDSQGDLLVAWQSDGRAFTSLADLEARAREEGPIVAWPLVVVAEPDLLNNYGMADRKRAAAALAIVAAAADGRNLPIVFDLTLPGLGASRNLLTLAFEPPFLAATIALIAAALAIGWRAFLRFGAPRAELPELAHGKTQLAVNGAGLIERTRRLHLLGEPYRALVGRRIAAQLALRESDDAAIERALAARGHEPGAFAAASERLRDARRPRELLRAAQALSGIERTYRK